MENNLTPYTKRYLGSFDTYFSTIGIIGAHECCLNFLGKGIETKEGKAFMLRVLDHLTDKSSDFYKETGSLFNIEAVPGEGCVTADMLVKTVDGDIPISDLVGRDNVWVWSYDDINKKIVIKKGYNIRRTRTNTKIVRVVFDNDTYLDLTPDHSIARNAWCSGNPSSITWCLAEELLPGQSIKILSFKKEARGHIRVNGHQKRTNILAEYYFNKKVEKGEVVHHIDGNKSNDSRENLIILSDADHRRIHVDPSNLVHGFGKDNTFYGKHHTEETKQKLSDAKKGIQWKPVNISMDEFKEKMRVSAKNKPQEKHSKWRRDIDTDELLRLYHEGYTYQKLADYFNCTTGLVQSRLKKVNLNHKVKEIIYLDTLEDVYNMEVEDTECYFAGDGILIHNCSYPCAKLDKEHFPDIITAGDDDAPYLTNSTMLPVGYTNDVFEALDHQDEFQIKYTGGSVLHMFIGESLPDGDTAKLLIKRVFENYKLPYVSITPSFSICPKHKYIKGEEPICPICGETTAIYSRVVGYFRKISSWNKGKRKEFSDRKTYKVT